MKYCTNCGASIKDDAKFCASCGFKAAEEENKPLDSVLSSDVGFQSVNETQMLYSTPSPEHKKVKRKFSKAQITILISLIIVFLAAGSFVCYKFIIKNKVNSAIAKGNELFDSMDYDGALQSFNSAANLDKGNSEAKLDIAKTYVAEGKKAVSDKKNEAANTYYNKAFDTIKDNSSLYMDAANSFTASDDTLYYALQILKKGYEATSDSSIKEKLDEIKNTMPGNLSSNILSGGLIAKEGDWVYYSNDTDSKSLYKMKADGSGKTKLTSDKATFINVADDWIYYISKDGIYKVKTDGTGHKMVRSFSDDEVYREPDTEGTSFNYLYVIGTKMYYLGYQNNPDQETPYGYIVSLNTDGTGAKKLNIQGSAYTMLVYKDWIYYWGSVEAGGAFKIKTDGTNDGTLFGSYDEDNIMKDNYLDGIYPDKDKIYFPIIKYTNSDCLIYSAGANLDFKNPKLITTYKFGGPITVSNGFIYYIKDNVLYQLSIKDMKEKTLCSVNRHTENLYVAGDYIYMADVTGVDSDNKTDFELYKVSISGGERQQVK